MVASKRDQTGLFKAIAAAACVLCAGACADDPEEAAWRATFERVLRRSAQQNVQWRTVPACRVVYGESGEAVPVLSEGLRADDPATRLRALEGLAGTGATGTAEPFVNALADPSPEVQAYAARILASSDPQTLFESVVSLMSQPPDGPSPDWTTVLPLLRDPLESPMLSALSSEETARTSRLTAAFSLGCMRSTAAIQPLVRTAETDDPELALCSTEALYRIGDPAVIPAMVRLMGHPSPQVRRTAIEALAALNTPMAMNALGEIACTPPADDAELGRRALDLLGATADTRVVPILIEVMRRNLGARRAAVAMLRKITREDLGDLPSDWAKWYEEQQFKLNHPAPAPEKPMFDVEFGP